MRQLIACLTISVVVSLLGCTRTTLEEDQVVFRPTIDDIGQVSCSWEQGSQRFKLFHPELDSLIRLSPGGDDGQSSYFLYVSIEADGSRIDRIKNVTVALSHSQSGGAASFNDDFQLTKIRPPMSPMNSDRLQWWSEFDISPDIAPDVHRNLEIRLVVQYQTMDGHTDAMDVTVPIEPIEITIPTSIH